MNTAKIPAWKINLIEGLVVPDECEIYVYSVTSILHTNESCFTYYCKDEAIRFSMKKTLKDKANKLSITVDDDDVAGY